VHGLNSQDDSDSLFSLKIEKFDGSIVAALGKFVFGRLTGVNSVAFLLGSTLVSRCLILSISSELLSLIE